jgi:hypothetical protein
MAADHAGLIAASASRQSALHRNLVICLNEPIQLI